MTKKTLMEINNIFITTTGGKKIRKIILIKHGEYQVLSQNAEL